MWLCANCESVLYECICEWMYVWMYVCMNKFMLYECMTGTDK
jgi:hypothetical protein